jgi:hypothetical protein
MYYFNESVRFKLELEPNHYNQIEKTELQEYIIKNLYSYKYYENIDFIKKYENCIFFGSLKNKLQIYITNVLNLEMTMKMKINLLNNYSKKSL